MAISYVQTDLVSRHVGTMPLVLTCPHGGSQQPPGVSPRKPKRTGPCPVITKGDEWTIPIAQAVAEQFEKLTAKTPFVVIADFHRRYIDANRSEDCAFSQNAAEPY